MEHREDSPGDKTAETGEGRVGPVLKAPARAGSCGRGAVSAVDYIGMRSGWQVFWKTAGTSLPQSAQELVRLGPQELVRLGPERGGKSQGAFQRQIKGLSDCSSVGGGEEVGKVRGDSGVPLSPQQQRQAALLLYNPPPSASSRAW